MICLSAIAGEFVNLGFDDVNLRNISKISGDIYSGQTSELVPGWTVGAGPAFTPQATVRYSSTPGLLVGDGGASLAPSVGGFGYMLALEPNGIEHGPVPVQILQVGRIPEWANLMSVDGLFGYVLVGIDDQKVSLGGWINSLDVGRFAGKDVTLSLSVISSTASFEGIRFTAVPEPSLSVLLLIGVLFFGVVRLRR